VNQPRKVCVADALSLCRSLPYCFVCDASRTLIKWRRSVVVSALASINVVNGHRAPLLLVWVTVVMDKNCGAGKPYQYVTSHLGQLSLRGISIEYHYRPIWLCFRWGVLTCVGWQVTLSDPIWQVTL